jgi:hypothetical protein
VWVAAADESAELVTVTALDPAVGALAGVPPPPWGSVRPPLGAVLTMWFAAFETVLPSAVLALAAELDRVCAALASAAAYAFAPAVKVWTNRS